MVELEIGQLDRKYEGLRIRDPGRLGRLTSSVAEHGQRHPVLVVPAPQGERYVLIDGYLRVAALATLGRDLVAAAALDLSETEALVLSQKLESRRRLTALEEGWFLRELVEGHGMSARELSLRLERSPSWVSRRLSLVAVLPVSVQEAVRQGRVRPQVAMKVLVPLARANASSCERLVAKLGKEPWSVREMERLYRAWRLAGRDERERLVEHPELYRKVDEELGGKREGGADPIGHDLGILLGVSTRLVRRLEEGAHLELDDLGRRRALRAFARAKEAFSELERRMEDELARS